MFKIVGCIQFKKVKYLEGDEEAYKAAAKPTKADLERLQKAGAVQILSGKEKD
jgi:hypothetical protein